MKLKVKIDDRDKFNGNDYVDTLVSVLAQTPHATDREAHTLRDRCTYVFDFAARFIETDP